MITHYLLVYGGGNRKKKKTIKTCLVMKKKLSLWAKENGISYRTAFFWIRDGKFPCKYERTVTGRYIVIDDEKPSTDGEITVIYARVSNNSRRKELQYQVDRIEEFCRSKGYAVTAIYKEVASGMNDKRKELWKAIDRKPTRIVIENKDRLTRFGFNYLERLLKDRGTEIIVLNEAAEDKEDLLKDMCSTIYSFCARLYGMRRAANKAKKVRETIENE